MRTSIVSLNSSPFEPLEDIDALEAEDKASGKAPRAQYVLAEQVTKLVHGEAGTDLGCRRITDSLFNGDVSSLTEDDFAQLAQDGMPHIELDSDADLQQALVVAELVPSAAVGYHDRLQRGVSHGEKQSDADTASLDSDKLFGRYTAARGKNITV